MTFPHYFFIIPQWGQIATAPLLLIVLGVSCQKNDDILSKEEMIETLIEDQDFIEHVKLINESKRNVISKKVDMSKINAGKVASSNSLEEVIETIKDSDAEGASLIAKNIQKRTELMVKVINKYPQLSSINQSDLTDVFEEAIKTVTKDLDEDFSLEIQKRLENDKTKN